MSSDRTEMLYWLQQERRQTALEMAKKTVELKMLEMPTSMPVNNVVWCFDSLSYIVYNIYIMPLSQYPHVLGASSDISTPEIISQYFRKKGDNSSQRIIEHFRLNDQ